MIKSKLWASVNVRASSVEKLDPSSSKLERVSYGLMN